ncbi:hypothetical protein GYA27_03580 [candidate division WWE3 bacterium]|uniref:Uncharacterized protein n=1 Tax=candidate division WWE3 bacterium TaxID=2053526 RepID=A0A7X9HH47_UNCKA|nr:hypothetical protein [candidate division WWE3 bacterium]
MCSIWRSDTIQTAVFIRGLPCTGKSTIANFLQETIKCTVIDPDLISKMDLCDFIFKNPKLIFLRNTKLLRFRYNLAKAIYSIKCGQSIAWCQMFSSVAGLGYTIKTLIKNCDPKIRLVVINLICDQAILIKRLENKTWITKEKLSQLAFSMDNVTGLPENIPIYTLNTKENLEVTKKAVLRIMG